MMIEKVQNTFFIKKAYAKAFKSYENIELGLSSEAFRDLTGAPVEIIFDLKY